MSLDDLKNRDNLRRVSFENCESFIHIDHRWVLPIIYSAQEKGSLPKPCTLVMFDAHHDSLTPVCIDEIRQLRESGFSVDDIICLCENKLSTNDDDWVKAAMELGLIDNAVIFGVNNLYDKGKFKIYVDHLEHEHIIEMLDCSFTTLFDYQGDLSDICKKRDYSDLWNILGWEFDQTEGFKFSNDANKILLDFDLDCFAVRWRGYLFPWPDEVFTNDFYVSSSYYTTIGWTGAMFVEELINRAGLITFAEEPEYCGGAEKSRENFNKVNRFLFSNKLSIED